jgi:lycopene epsilon-cyclase
MECLGLGARNFASMTVPFWPALRSPGITLNRKQPLFRRCGLYRHFVRVRASAGSESCVTVDFKEGFADDEDYVKAGGSELLFVQMQQNKLMEKQSKLADKVSVCVSFSFVCFHAHSDLQNQKFWCVVGF